MKRYAEFVTNLFFRNHRWPRIVGLTRVARQDQAAAARSQLPCYGRSILIQCVSTNGMVTTAIEKELKGSIQVRQMEHIGDHETHLNPGGLSAFFRALEGMRWTVAVAASALTSVVTYVVFKVWLYVRLPPGPWGL